MVKLRLDIALVNKGLAASRQQARALIMAGRVLVNREPMEKPGAQVGQNDEVSLRGDDPEYVSRGGIKLQAALEAFDIRVENCVCMDVGASTGGFTDCLLQHGASQVYAVDVGYGQLAWRLRQDSRVEVIERTNIRYMPFEKIGRVVDLITIDVSFISLKIVVPAVRQFLHPGGRIIALVKPQFEVGKGNVGKGGVVRDPQLHEQVLGQLAGFFYDAGLQTLDTIPSPITGPKGNREFLTLLIHRKQAVLRPG
ncbi:MAG: RNA methyltransferase [Deltaproteobacteria bacterium SG8_13]|nr:MAG: RNA methyltransferase [Deltaproteobacteria bacterium SG8_13]